MAARRRPSVDVAVDADIIVERMPARGVRSRVAVILLDMLRTPRAAAVRALPLDVPGRSGAGSDP